MAIRLLDWSSNPLVALWFACASSSLEESAHLYIYKAGEDTIPDPAKDTDPFIYPVTQIFQPAHKTDRAIAQNGWFSVRPFYAQMHFKPLAEDAIRFLSVFHIDIPAQQTKPSIKRTSPGKPALAAYVKR